MDFHDIYAAGVDVHGSHACVSEAKELVYLSVLGPESSVNAVLAAALEDEAVSISRWQEGVTFVRRSPLHYMKLVRPLGSGKRLRRASDKWVHGFLILKVLLNTIDADHQEDWWPKEGMCQFGMLLPVSSTEEQIAQACYNRLRLYLKKTPIHAEWKLWLWRRLQGRVTMFSAVLGNQQAYIVLVHEAWLQDEIQDALRKREPELVGIFKQEETICA